MRYSGRVQEIVDLAGEGGHGGFGIIFRGGAVGDQAEDIVPAGAENDANVRPAETDEIAGLVSRLGAGGQVPGQTVVHPLHQKKTQHLLGGRGGDALAPADGGEEGGAVGRAGIILQAVVLEHQAQKPGAVIALAGTPAVYRLHARLRIPVSQQADEGVGRGIVADGDAVAQEGIRRLPIQGPVLQPLEDRAHDIELDEAGRDHGGLVRGERHSLPLRERGEIEIPAAGLRLQKSLEQGAYLRGMGGSGGGCGRLRRGLGRGEDERRRCWSGAGCGGGRSRLSPAQQQQPGQGTQQDAQKDRQQKLLSGSAHGLVVGAAVVLVLIVPDEAYVIAFILVEDLLAEGGGTDGALVPGLAVEVGRDLRGLEDPPVAGKDLIAGKAKLLVTQTAEIGCGEIAAIALGQKVFRRRSGGRRRGRAGRYDGRRGGQRRGGDDLHGRGDHRALLTRIRCDHRGGGHDGDGAGGRRDRGRVALGPEQQNDGEGEHRDGQHPKDQQGDVQPPVGPGTRSLGSTLGGTALLGGLPGRLLFGGRVGIKVCAQVHFGLALGALGRRGGGHRCAALVAKALPLPEQGAASDTIHRHLPFCLGKEWVSASIIASQASNAIRFLRPLAQRVRGDYNRQKGGESHDRKRGEIL